MRVRRLKDKLCEGLILLVFRDQYILIILALFQVLLPALGVSAGLFT